MIELAQPERCFNIGFSIFLSHIIDVIGLVLENINDDSEIVNTIVFLLMNILILINLKNI